ncbi:MAG TPA: heterodisulfide reductase-related iron-sulfur binding cluster [Candidatus Eisenbacteria bacterium]|jgi:glycolate oxidase iron-sulfur subunit
MSAPEPVPPAPAPSQPSWFDREDAPLTPELHTCIHCGLCLTACPTYRTLKIEPDSPRGRLYLMRGLAEGRISPSDPLVGHLDRCLDCRACETVCPAGVPYSRLLEATRGQLARRWRRASPLRTLGHWVLRSVLPHAGRVELAADLLRIGQAPPLAALLATTFAQRLLPRFARQGLAMTPRLLPRGARALERVAARLPEGARMERRADALVFHPAGKPKGHVAFHTSCVMPAMFPETNQESVRLMVVAGVRVTVPRAQTCCGALQAHAGLRREAKALGAANARAFAGEVDFVVSNSAGCGAALRETGHLLHDASAAEAAEALSTRTRDVAEVLAHYNLPATAVPLHSARDAARPLRVTYHDACHLAHAQRVREAPRRLLKALPGVELVTLPNADWCCGSAGVYNLTHPEMANAQLEGKLDAVASVAPEVVVASNPGCLLHMRRGAAARGLAPRFVHLVELLGEAFPAPGRPGA